MESISLRNFRCFRDEQKARLAPLTLLVGENSSGKTSFLAMIRALWDVAYERIPDFKEIPYDLGSFDDIVHHRGRRDGRAQAFEAAFEITFSTCKGRRPSVGRFSVIFGQSGPAPVPVQRRFKSDACWVEEHWKKSELREIRVGTSRGSWKCELGSRGFLPAGIGFRIAPSYFFLMPHRFDDREGNERKFIPFNDSPNITQDDLSKAGQLLGYFDDHRHAPPYASAPVRSQPRRIYEPGGRAVSDPEGDYIPLYLANTYFQDKQAWISLKGALENFGSSSGMFDEIEIKPLGKREGEPFQLKIRKFGGRLKGPSRNIKDVGYGVSQVLPVVTELVRESVRSIFLMQQPEVHLHPSAQAALGSLFCEIAGPDRQLVVETHSDHLLDRVRMDVRDGKGKLAPEDVSILYFERGELDVCIHSLRLDGEGNVRDAPIGYRAFFMEEMKRSLGF